MNKNQKGFSLHIILILLFVIAVIGLVGWRVLYTQNSSAPPVSSAPTTPEFTSNLDAGTHTLDLKANDKVLLPSGAVLSLPETDIAVPEFTYDKTYSTGSDKRLLIHTRLAAYHNGYAYAITTGTCHKAEKGFDDYTAVVVTDCSITVDIQKSHPSTLNTANTTKQYVVTEKNNPPDGPRATLSTDPFLFVSRGDGRLTYPINGAAPYLDANDGKSVSLGIVTDYGVGRVSYNAQEFTAKSEKQVTIGGSTVTVKPSSITCTPAYLQGDTCAIVSDKFIFDVSYSRQKATNPEIIIQSLD